MSTETVQVSRELMLLRGKFAGRLQELAVKLGISKQRLSAYLNGAKPTKRIERDVSAVFEQEFPGESGRSTVTEQGSPNVVNDELRPVAVLEEGGKRWTFYTADAVREFSSAVFPRAEAAASEALRLAAPQGSTPRPATDAPSAPALPPSPGVPVESTRRQSTQVPAPSEHAP